MRTSNLPRRPSRGNLTSLRDPKELLISAARESRRSLFRDMESTQEPPEQSHELVTAEKGPAASDGNNGVGGTSTEAASALPNRDVSVMPTVEESPSLSLVSAREKLAPIEGGEVKQDHADAAYEKDHKKVFPESTVSENGVLPSLLARTSTASWDPKNHTGHELEGQSSKADASPGGPSRVTKGNGHWRSSSSVCSSEGHCSSKVESIARMFRRVSISGRSIDRSRDRSLRGTSHHDGHHGPVKLAARGKLTEEDEAMLSDSEADYDAFDSPSERTMKRLLSPNFSFFRGYATFMLVVLLLYVFYMPVRIGFFPRESGGWMALDVVWEVIFFFDIVIHLNTGYIDSETGVVVYDRRKIFWRYAKGWLLIDFCAAFPFTFLPGLGPGADSGYHEVAYLLSVPKVFRLYGLLSMAQDNHRLSEGVFLGVRTLLSVIVTAHVFGCGWYMLATLMHTECEALYEAVYDGGSSSEAPLEYALFGVNVTIGDFIDSECPWIYRNDYFLLPLGRRYLGSVYWSLTTLTTVGYGDISARTLDEQVYSMAVQVVGVAWYGYNVGMWAIVLNSFDTEKNEQRSKLREVVAFSKAAGLPPDMAKKVRQHFRFSIYRKDNWISFNEQDIVADMPASLRADVVTFVQRHTISQVPFFSGKNTVFVADVVVQLKPRLFRVGDTLYREGAQAEELFFINGGRILLKYNNTHVGHVKQGQVAGLIGLVSCESHKLTAVVAREVHCLGLSRVSFLELVENYPKEMQDLVSSARALAQSVSLASSAAKTEFMANPVLAHLIADASHSMHPAGGSPVEYDPTQAHWRGDTSFGDPWAQFSIGKDEASQASSRRGPLPIGWEAAMQQSQHAVSRAVTSAGDHMRGKASSDASTHSSGHVEYSLRGTVSRAFAPVNNAVNSTVNSTVEGEGGGGDAVMVATSSGVTLDDAVNREVTRQMASVEARLSCILERLEGVLGADSASTALRAAADAKQL